MTRLAWFVSLFPAVTIAAAAPVVAQQGRVAGTVVEQNGAPAVGAEVSVRGTTLLSRTDQRGRFEIQGLSGTTASLRVRLVPYRPIDVQVTVGDLNVRIELQRAVTSLQDIVITGTATGEQARREVGNAVATVRVTEQIESAPVQTIGQLINARAPGVQVSPPGGFAGSGERIMIRGRSSLSLRVTPLVYVDGVRVDNLSSTGGGGIGSSSRLNDFHPDEIESVEIIKGPAAGTLYGTEAQSGVIQLITKRGKPGPARIGVSTRTGAAYFANPEGRWLTNYFRDPGGQIVAFNLAQQETDRGTPLFRTGFLQGYTVDVSGGSEATQYYGAVHYDSDEGAVQTSNFQRFGGRLNLTVTSNPKWDANGQIGFSLNRTEYPNGNYVFGSLLSRPATRATPSRGFFTAPSEVWTDEFRQDENVNHTTVGAQIRHRPASWLRHQLRAGLDLTNTNGISLTRRMAPANAVFFSPGQAAGLKTVNQRDLVSTTIDYSATATREFGANLKVETTAGAQYYRQLLTTLSATGRTFPSSDVTSIAGAATRLGSDDRVENVTVGMYGQAQIAWKNRLYFTAAVRGDDNSAFGQSFDFVTYPKVSASWVVSDEPFWKIGAIEDFRLRAAWGQSGQQPQAFAALRTYEPITGQAGQSAVTPQFVGNDQLGPERSAGYEIGFDATFLGQRIALEATYYNQKTKDAIVLRNVAPSSGFPQQQFINAGTVQNKGVEFLLDGRVIQTPNFSWDVGVNFSTNANEVLNLGIPGTPYLEFGFGNRFQPGFPIYAAFARKVVKADRDAVGKPINIQCDGGLAGGLPGGAPVACATAPRVFVGRPDPKYDAAVSSTVRLFNRLSVYGLVDFKRGHTTWTSSLWCPGILGCEEELYPERFDPVVAASSVLGYTDDAAWWVDLSFAKLRELSISYQVPTKWATAFGATRATVSLSGRNLHTWTKFKGLDPENTALFPEAATFGTPFEQNEVPQLRQFVFRINLNF